MRPALLIAVMVLMACCVKREVLYTAYDAVDASEQPIPIHYEFVDLPSEHRIEISFCNHLKQAVCLTNDNWPGRSGWMLIGSRGMSIVIGQQRFSLDLVNGDYSPGYAEYVPPEETIKASISYDSFHIPAALSSEEKHLEFFPEAYRCVRRNVYR
jgi:hypothetical protein